MMQSQEERLHLGLCGETENLWSHFTRMQRSASFSLGASPRAPA
jgi:hypothetical protein